VALVALFIGLVIAAQGVFGLAAPEVFLRALRYIQTPPVIYLAAAIRVVFGVVLFRAAPESRAPTFLRVLGFVIVIGGLLTPFFGVRIGHAILDWWSAGGPPLVRAWAGFSLALGVFIVYAVARSGTRRSTRTLDDTGG
jgi:hypothetical protein